MEKQKHEEFTRYEVARILGARALQIAMDAPLLLKIEKEKLEEMRFDPLKIAEMEFNSGTLPISVKRPFPQKSEEALKREKLEEGKKEEEIEKKEEEEIKESGEIMEIAQPNDEVVESEEKEETGEEA